MYDGLTECGFPGKLLLTWLIQAPKSHLHFPSTSNVPAFVKLGFEQASMWKICPKAWPISLYSSAPGTKLQSFWSESEPFPIYQDDSWFFSCLHAISYTSPTFTFSNDGTVIILQPIGSHHESSPLGQSCAYVAMVISPVLSSSGLNSSGTIFL